MFILIRCKLGSHLLFVRRLDLLTMFPVLDLLPHIAHIFAISNFPLIFVYRIAQYASRTTHHHYGALLAMTWFTEYLPSTLVKENSIILKNVKNG